MVNTYNYDDLKFLLHKQNKQNFKINKLSMMTVLIHRRPNVNFKAYKNTITLAGLINCTIQKHQFCTYMLKISKLM